MKAIFIITYFFKNNKFLLCFVIYGIKMLMRKFLEATKNFVRGFTDEVELVVVDSKLAKLELEPMSPDSSQALRELYKSSREKILARIEARENNQQQGATA